MEIKAKVEQIKPNQFIIKVNGYEVLQSYNSVIAIRTEDNKIILDVNKWDYSTTTGKYRNLFLNEDKKATQDKINKGIYTLKDLNEGVF